ncbi:DUF262 domain-containing protein [uncultured Alistipes sp.]|uniref:DUF262 domain-containing protein n=1 Tax=uncultured Alistipes sp. TaxID=538949 RepID=UPI001F88813B|nr:DUF262 domain-containing protein [uncultured Alistipes sp.]HIY14750.1 DUF262 domain-containing protein [Candidatus Alistipes cottocaccae]
MNTLELKSVAELQDLAFYIPDYQRGYRWTQRQVEDLLNDIFEFSQKDNAGIYCLQPLVVVPRSSDEQPLDKAHATKVNMQWEVVDGQQRLTTIRLILEVLGRFRFYDITYQTRRDSAEFLNGITTVEAAGEKAEEKAKNNIDFYHIYLAVTVICEWLKEKMDEKKKKLFQDILLNRVKFIWYETKEDPKEVFARLNIGKISLTNAELIKALLLNKSNFDSSDDDKIRLWQQEIAVEWDVIEYALQSNEFWLFLNAPGDERPTRIDYVFDMICRCDLLKCKDEKEPDATDNFRTFRYFYHYLAVQKQKEISLAQAVRTIWENVREIFHTLREWFDDMELYHYIGYLIYMGRNVDEIYKQWTGPDNKSGKFGFIEKYLKEEIKKTIPCKDIENTVYEVESAQNKGGSKTNCRPILLLHNLQTVINQNRILGANAKYKNGVFYKFPFHLYKSEGWDVEHIDSNTENGLNDIQSQREWLLNAYFGLQDKAYQTLRDQIQEFFKTRKGDEQSADSDKQTVRNEQFVELRRQIEDISDNNRLDQNEKNKIWNFTLLDSSTNRSYGNAIFPAKRRVIIGKDQGKRFSLPTIDENEEIVLGSAENGSSSFIPPCTRYVFLKYYNTASFDPNAWTKDDAETYKNNIKEILKDFLS